MTVALAVVSHAELWLMRAAFGAGLAAVLWMGWRMEIDCRRSRGGNGDG